MSQLILNRGVNSRRFLNFKMSFGPYFLIGSLIVFVVLITVITLMYSTRQVTKGYVLNKLDYEHSSLIKEGERQEMQISRVRSLDYIQNSPQIDGMIRPNNVVYLDSDTAIASR